ncbi:SAM-dependent methlyltransferase [Mycolicibacterium smegmatis]|nr:Fmt protein [Mycolicibacterium smegmatis MC2 155]AIU12295.1 SAM-dependent methlyltransferase [Mycolicibacterium smegmatis]AIU05670.1 SAM-dependent methlyltransferase [Mycolicibacterium smegmatis MC2 155]AIU18919.1 SAM-dependent methlyltransferase [Mycolicibacterium smegmatis]TBH39677.1 class I SAM-dependent methyltransferase [Mycolicibacterium smegmatis MC2 155]
MEARDRVAWRLNIKVAQQAQKLVYRYATRRLKDDDVVFLNYGYEEDPPMGIPLSESDELNRYSIQLYHSTAAQADVEGKRVLEVGCGHGGGASYLARTFRPATYTGLDLNSDGINFCRRRHNIAGLEFVQGDAQDLPFPDKNFDAVLNVESSHLYPRFDVFLTEVARVLRPGGYFLYTDARPRYDIPEWERALADAPLQMLSQRAINFEVVRGMEKNLDALESVVDRVAPALLRDWIQKYGPARRAYEELRENTTEYRMYCFVKPAE